MAAPKEILDLVYELYDLTPEEIAIVEGTSSPKPSENEARLANTPGDE